MRTYLSRRAQSVINSQNAEVNRRVAGFTLAETVVGLAILAILCAVVAGVLVFGVNMMNEQRARTNADLLCSMLSQSVSEALEYTTDKPTVSPDGKTVSFTTSEKNAYRGSGTYQLSTEDGIIKIKKTPNTDSFSIVTESSYIDGLKAGCTFTANESKTIKVTVTIYSDATMTTKMTENTFDVQLANPTEASTS